MSTLIKLENINKTYQLADSSFSALKNINLELAKGEMLALVGMSGSGKSTLMNIIGFLDNPSSGKYFFNQQNVSQLTQHELAHIRNLKIGFIFQAFFLLPRISALQNVMLPLFYRGVPRALAKEKAQRQLDKVGVGHLAQHKPNQLSGGQQQRVAIARALVSDPEIILADEPTGALDSQTGHDVMNFLADLHAKEGRTIMIITHDHNISKRCPRKINIKDGRLTES